jgi:hypothetical protein
MGAPLRFRRLRKTLAPRWLTEGDGEKVGYSLDLVLDGFVERLRQGLYARLPQNDPNGTTTAPDDALEAMGRDRRVVRGISETAASYALRLRLWLDDRRRAGNPYMLMQKLAEYTGAGPAFRTVDARGNWFSRAADGTETAVLKQENWDWNGEPVGRRWARFWVIVYPNGLWTPSEFDWGDTAGPGWGEGTQTLGSTATPEHVAKMRHLIADWKGAGRRCVNIIIAFDPASFDPSAPEPDGLWERQSKNVNGVMVPSRLSTARYWNGTTYGAR